MILLSSHIRDFCSQSGLMLNTDLGQHFLVDESVLQAIVEAADVTPGDTVFEIGPGVGVLTKELLAAGANVTAIELDKRLIPLLKKYVGDDAAALLTVIQGNALQTPLPEEPYIVVANIPYHITSPLLRHIFLESSVTPKTMTLLIQREVAERICDTENAGMLTILVSLFGTPRIAATVPPDAFLPPPKVDSAVLHVDCFKEPLASKEVIAEVFRLAKIAFAQKRKILRNSFSTFPGGAELLSALCIDEKRRPQTLSTAEWIALAEESLQQ